MLISYPMHMNTVKKTTNFKKWIFIATPYLQLKMFISASFETKFFVRFSQISASFQQKLAKMKILLCK